MKKLILALTLILSVSFVQAMTPSWVCEAEFAGLWKGLIEFPMDRIYASSKRDLAAVEAYLGAAIAELQLRPSRQTEVLKRLDYFIPRYISLKKATLSTELATGSLKDPILKKLFKILGIVVHFGEAGPISRLLPEGNFLRVTPGQAHLYTRSKMGQHFFLGLIERKELETFLELMQLFHSFHASFGRAWIAMALTYSAESTGFEDNLVFAYRVDRSSSEPAYVTRGNFVYQISVNEAMARIFESRVAAKLSMLGIQDYTYTIEAPGINYELEMYFLLQRMGFHFNPISNNFERVVIDEKSQLYFKVAKGLALLEHFNLISFCPQTYSPEMLAMSSLPSAAGIYPIQNANSWGFLRSKAPISMLDRVLVEVDGHQIPRAYANVIFYLQGIGYRWHAETQTWAPR